MTRITVDAGGTMQDHIQVTAERIRRLQIQGARNVAIAAIKALENLASQTEARTKKEFVNELSRAKETLFVSRETEPLMRNAIRLILNRVGKTKESKVKNLANIY